MTFDPAVVGTIASVITIANNISQGESYTFTVAGTGTGVIEIAVSGNGQKIANGDLTPSATDSTAFGQADVTTETITKTYWLVNEGNIDLIIGTISSSDSAFRVQQPSQTIISRDDSVRFMVTFDPAVAGPATATIVIPNNDTDAMPNDPYYFQVNATGIDNGHIIVKGNEQLILNGDSIPSGADSTFFGRIPVSGRMTRTYWLLNTGTANLTITNPIASSHPVFTVHPLQDTVVLPGDSIHFMVTFEPAALGPASAVIRIFSNDPEDSLYTFQLSGKGSGLVDMAVKGNNQLIAAGDSTPSVADSTDFGKVFINKKPKIHTYQIINQGEDTLHITGAISSSDGRFVIGKQPADSVLLPGDSVSFTVVFTPADTGTSTATIHIPNDDAYKNPYTFAVRGEGLTYFNGVPVAVDDAYVMDQNTALSGQVLFDNGVDTLSHDVPHTVSLVTDVSRGTLDVQSDGSFTFLPEENFWGKVQFIYQLCDADQDCDEATVTISVEGAGIITYNAFSPDEDGVNDTWEIDNIENYPANQVVIFNRWGNSVWQAKGYNNQSVAWKGQSNTGLRVGDQLPDGTYYYIIKAAGLAAQQGYVVISRK